MQFISRNIHGVLDYVVGILLLIAPMLLGFSDVPGARNAAIASGAVTLVYSILTNYECGLIRVLPFGVHLTLDALSGLFLIASPWLLGFADRVTTPHVVVGIIELVVVACTRKQGSAAVTGIPADTRGSTRV
jgi:hypothetical protein